MTEAKFNSVLPKKMGIRGRSFLAFAVLTIFTLLASIVGWVSYNHIEDELERVIEVNIHSLKLMADLKEYGTSISTKAPTLYEAKDKETQEMIWAELNQNIDAMLQLSPQNKQANTNKRNQFSIVSHIETLVKPLESLNQNITDQLKIKTRKQVFSEKLRWQSASFLNDIDILIINAQKNWHRISDPTERISSLGQNLGVLYRIKADVSLLSNLINRVQHLPDLSSLIAVQLHSKELQKSLEKDLELLNPPQEYLALEKSIIDLIQLAQGDNNIFSIRRKERDISEEGQLQITQIRNDFSQLNLLLSKQSYEAEQEALEATKNVQETIKQGRIWSIFLVGGSLLFSILIVWLYVGHNMVARITSLNSSMRSIAKGNLDQQVLIKGNDEITAMAHSLLSFRDQLSSLEEELVQSGKLAALGQLSAGIAHEVNQPLSAIRHYTHNSSRLIQTGKLKEAEENLAHINLLTKRIISTITQLKSLAKGQPAKLINVDVKTAINNSVMMLSGHKILADTELTVDISSCSDYVFADPVQLEQVIVNLLLNSLDALVNTKEKQIRIFCLEHEDTLDIKISDNGKGIDKNLEKKIFDTFFTTKRRGQNIGLGLSISYNIIKNFGGNLSVDSEKAKGATFCIQLSRCNKGSHE